MSLFVCLGWRRNYGERERRGPGIVRRRAGYAAAPHTDGGQPRWLAVVFQAEGQKEGRDAAGGTQGGGGGRQQGGATVAGVRVAGVLSAGAFRRGRVCRGDGARQAQRGDARG